MDGIACPGEFLGISSFLAFLNRMRQETVLFLVRHGEAEQNVRRILDSFPGNPEFGLTEAGREQVRKSAEAIAHEGVDFLFSSPIRRARETAEAIAEACGGVSVSFDDRLRETDFGVWSGRSADDFWAKYPDPNAGRRERRGRA